VAVFAIHHDCAAAIAAVARNGAAGHLSRAVFKEHQSGGREVRIPPYRLIVLNFPATNEELRAVGGADCSTVCIRNAVFFNDAAEHGEGRAVGMVINHAGIGALHGAVADDDVAGQGDGAAVVNDAPGIVFAPQGDVSGEGEGSAFFNDDQIADR